MQAHLGVAATRAREAVAFFLARGRAARLAACVVVAAAAVVWLGALVVLLRVVSLVALAAAVVWLLWLVGRVWRNRPFEWEGQSGSLTTALRARARSLAAREEPIRAEPQEVAAVDSREWEAGLAAVRSAVAALNADLADWQERLVHEVERCRRELAAQIDALPELVGHAVPVDAPPELRPVAPSEPDLEAVLHEIEADLRLDKIEERERLLAEREERLDRRERDLAAFVDATQARIA